MPPFMPDLSFACVALVVSIALKVVLLPIYPSDIPVIVLVAVKYRYGMHCIGIGLRSGLVESSVISH